MSINLIDFKKILFKGKGGIMIIPKKETDA